MGGPKTNPHRPRPQKQISPRSPLAFVHPYPHDLWNETQRALAARSYHSRRLHPLSSKGDKCLPSFQDQNRSTLGERGTTKKTADVVLQSQVKLRRTLQNHTTKNNLFEIRTFGCMIIWMQDITKGPTKPERILGISTTGVIQLALSPSLPMVSGQCFSL